MPVAKPSRRLFTVVSGLSLASPWLGAASAAHASDSPTGTVVLTVAAYPAVDAIVKAALPGWQAQNPGVQVKVVSRQFADHHTAMTTALSTAIHLPDVMALEVGYVGRFAQGGGLEDLRQPAFGIDAVRDRWVPYTVAQATNRRGAIVAAPGDIGPGTLLYRHDVLERAGLAEADLTRSWESYVQSGVQLKARTGAFLVAHARDVKDILIRADLKPGDGLYFDAQGAPQVNTPRFARAFDLARQVRSNKLDARVVAWSSDWSEGFKRGRLATQMTGAWLAGHLSNWLAPDTRGLWRAAPLPGGLWAAYGGTFFALPRAADASRKALAWSLLKWLTLQPAQQLAAFKTHDAFPALLSTHGDAFFDEPIAFLGGQRARQLWREATRHIQAPSVHKHDAFAQEVTDTELDKVLDQGKPVAQALEDAQRLLVRRAKR